MPHLDRQKAGRGFVICCVRFTAKIPSVVPRLGRKPYCSSDNCDSYQLFNRDKVILMINLQTVDPILIPRYFDGSLFDPFPFQSVFKSEFPQAFGRSRLFHKLRVILCIFKHNWSVTVT